MYFMVIVVIHLIKSSLFGIAKAGKSSSETVKEKPITSKLPSSFADPEKFVEEILERTSAIVISEVSTVYLFSLII